MTHHNADHRLLHTGVGGKSYFSAQRTGHGTAGHGRVIVSADIYADNTVATSKKTRV